MKKVLFISIFAISFLTSCAQVGAPGFIPATILQGRAANPEQISLSSSSNATYYVDLDQNGEADMVEMWGAPPTLELKDEYTAILFEVLIGWQNEQPRFQLMDVLVKKSDLDRYKYSGTTLWNLEKSMDPYGGKRVTYIGDRMHPKLGIMYQAYRIEQNFVMVRIR